MAERLSQSDEFRSRCTTRVSCCLQHRCAGCDAEYAALQHRSSRLSHRPLLYGATRARLTLELAPEIARRFLRGSIRGSRERRIPMAKFEDSLKQLETIVGQLEKGDLPLEDSIKLFEEGIHLSAVCKEELDAAEGKVQILLKQRDGSMKAEPFPQK